MQRLIRDEEIRGGRSRTWTEIRDAECRDVWRLGWREYGCKRAEMRRVGV